MCLICNNSGSEMLFLLIKDMGTAIPVLKFQKERFKSPNSESCSSFLRYLLCTDGLIRNLCDREFTANLSCNLSYNTSGGLI